MYYSIEQIAETEILTTCDFVDAINRENICMQENTVNGSHDLLSVFI